MSEFSLGGETERPIKRRTRRDPKPRFMPDVSPQLDAVMGCPVLSVPGDDMAWRLREIAERFDYSSVEQERSSLGRHGHNPRHVVAVWIYASLRGVHHSTKVERATATDAAYRLLSGGRKISSSVLRKFRQRNAAFFGSCIEQTVQWALAEGLVPTEEMATDSMRLRAHASSKAVRTVTRSRTRLDELAATDVNGLSPESLAKHEEKVRKHERALEACTQAGRSSVVLTNPSATLMKFPNGGSGPGHRVTATVAGVSERIVISVLVDASTCDYGKLPEAVRSAREVLVRCGLPKDARLQVAADPGYYSREDLAFAAESRDWVDVLIPEKAQANSGDLARGVFGRDRFTIREDKSAVCAAGNPMKGPWQQANGRLKYKGVGCQSCPLRAQCTTGSIRYFYVDPTLDRLHHSMNDRMAQPDAAKRYSQRIATVEPVFASIQDAMAFRRSTTRHGAALVAEILLKVLAHNLSRLIARRSLLVLTFSCEF